MIRWTILTVLLVALAAFLFISGHSVNLSGVENTLIAINISVAIVVTNFSFIAYQNSEYRQFQKGFSPSLLCGCVCILILGMTPLIAMVCLPKEAAPFGIAALPITALLSVMLVGLAKVEGSPESIVDRLTPRKIRRAIRQYSKSLLQSEAEWKQLEFAKPQEMATHEWSWYPAPPINSSNPFTVLSAVGGIAAKTGNIYVTAKCAEALLQSLDLCEKLRKRKKGEIPNRVDEVIKDSLGRLISYSEQADSTGTIVSRVLDVLATNLGKRTDVEWPAAGPCFYISGVLLSSGERWMGKGNSEIAKIPLIMIRMLCQKGLNYCDKHKNDEEDINSIFFSYNLRSLASMIHGLGTIAIKQDDSNFLYRVFDAYGWLGCSAVKCKNRQVTAACIRALAQLGREARRAGLECHWDKCAVQPAAHAKERIQWIMSWISQMDAEIREHWLHLISQGVSRLSGRTTVAKFEFQDGKTYYGFEESENPHIESFSSEAGSRDLDYSDFSMLKDFELYGLAQGHMIMHGPTVPLKSG